MIVDSLKVNFRAVISAIAFGQAVPTGRGRSRRRTGKGGFRVFDA
jgi:hypothetical protein